MKVGIVGSGMVGSAAAFAIGLRGVASEVVLVDRDAALAEAHALDIAHAMPFGSGTVMRHGGYDALKGARVIIIAAGVAQRSDETRIDLLGRNAAVFREVIGEVMRVCPDPILLIASNPVDVMTQISVAISGLPAHRVIGSGTILDTARFRSLLGTHLGISPRSMHAYVLGEHGDSEVLAWSEVSIGGIPLEEFCVEQGRDVTPDVRAAIDDQVRNAAYRIIAGKGATYYGIGSALARIVSVIIGDQRSILTVCTPAAEVAGVPEVTVALPNLLGGSGVLSTCLFSLTDDEYTRLRASAQVVRAAIASLDAASPPHGSDLS